jgi:hypothetical protein
MSATPDPELGSILLNQKLNKGNIGNGIFLLLCGLLSLAFGLATLILAPVSRVSILGGIAFIGVGLSLCVFVGIMLRRYWMHVFLQERGICEYRQGRARSLRYDQVDELTYSTLRIFMHGFYIHTVQKLALKSHGLPGPPLVSTLIFKETDRRSSSETRTALTDVRKMVSERLEDMFVQKLRLGEMVDWTPELRIGSRGLDVADRKGVGEHVEWQRVTNLEVNQGIFRLWVNSNAKPLHQTTTAQPNFFPAYSLALRLWKQFGS